LTAISQNLRNPLKNTKKNKEKRTKTKNNATEKKKKIYSGNFEINLFGSLASHHFQELLIKFWNQLINFVYILLIVMSFQNVLGKLWL